MDMNPYQFRHHKKSENPLIKKNPIWIKFVKDFLKNSNISIT